MENLIFECPVCKESITLMDIAGAERVRDAITWVDQTIIYTEWIKAISDFEIEHICK